MSKITLYGLDASPAVRACLLTLKALNLPYEYVIVNLFNKEQLSEKYLSKNPQHTIPTLEDNGTFIWDSHAIMAYLVRKYGKDDALYPKDFFQRAIVDQRLHFESGVAFQGALRSIVGPLVFGNNPNIPLSKIDAIVEVYDLLEQFLKDKDYVASDNLTIADFSLISTTTSMVAFLDIDPDKYPRITAWVKRMQELTFYQEANGSGVKQFIGLIKSKKPVVVP